MAHLAYYFSTFPALTTTFSQHQVRATEELGLKYILVANRRPDPHNFHPQDDDLRQRTFYLAPVQPWAYLRANLGPLSRWPGRYAGTLPLALRLHDHSPGQVLKNLAHLAGAAALAEYLLARQVPHVHVHFAYGAAEVALFLEALCGLPYSLSIHGGLDMKAPPWSNPEPPGTDLPLRVLHIGRLVPVKTQEVLILALARLRNQGRDFHCRIVGDGPLGTELQNLIQSLHLQDRIQLLGACFQAEVTRLYDWSQVLVLSSRSDGTPMVIIEAMAKARPVIAPRLTAIPEMVTAGNTGYLFRPEDAEDLAFQLSRLMAQPEDLVRLGLKGRRRALELFDLNRNARKLMAVFARELPWVSGFHG